MKINNKLSLKKAIIALLFLSSRFMGQPVLTNVSAPQTAQLLEKYEIVLDALNPATMLNYNNPYNYDNVNVICEFWSPSNRYYKVSGFFYESVSPVYVTAGPPPSDYPGAFPTTYPYDKVETMNLTGPKNWRVRFTPTETGVWNYRISAGDQSASISYYPASGFGTFTCSGSTTKPGFVRLANQHYLKFSNGVPYYPVGLSYPWGFTDTLYRDYGTREFIYQMDNLSMHGVNFMRAEINVSSGMNIIGPDPRTSPTTSVYSGETRGYNPRDAWQFDKVVEHAEQKGIYINLALLAHQLFADDGYGGCSWQYWNPFHQPVNQGGTCKFPYDFLTNKIAKEQTKKLFRYIVARWGYSTSLMSYELWDEADRLDILNQANPCQGNWCPTPPTLNQDIIDWHLEMATYIKSIDPHRHLLTTGYADLNHPTGYSVYFNLDFTQTHNYLDLLDPNCHSYSKALWDAAQQYTDISANPASAHRKPYQTGETFYMYIDKVALQKDPHFYEVHSIMWSGMLSGAMGPPSIWDFNNFHKANYVAYTNPQSHFLGIKKYTLDLPQLSEQFKPTQLLNSNGARVYYLQNINQDRIYGWIQDTDFEYKNIMTSSTYSPYLVSFNTANKPPVNTSYIQSFNVKKKGQYEVKWYDTESGIIAATQTVVSGTNNNLETISLTVPQSLISGSKYGDAAFMVRYICDDRWNAGVLNADAPAIARANSPVTTLGAYAFYISSTDDRVHRMMHAGFYWMELDVNTSAPTARANSDLVSDNSHVYYIGADHKVYALNQSSSWQAQQVSPGAINPNSSLAVKSTGNEIYYVALDNTIHRLYLNSNVWQDAALPSVQVLKNSDMVSATNGSDHFVYYIGSDLRVHKLTCNSSGIWSNQPLTPSSNIRFAMENNFPLPGFTNVNRSSLAVSPATGDVFFIANDSQIHYIEYITGNEIILSGPLNIRNLPSDCWNALVSDKYLSKVYYIGSDNRIHQYYYSGSWIYAPNNVNDAPSVSSGLEINSSSSGIFFTGNDNRIWSSYWGCVDDFKGGRLISGNDNESAIPAISDAFEVNLYPNPANDELNISLKRENSNSSKIEVFDIKGRSILTESFSGDNWKIDLKDLKSGLYLIRVVCNHEQVIKKFIKQ